MSDVRGALPHEPVLLQEVLSHLNISPTGTYIDATFGSGGHTRAILSQLRAPGRVLAIDMDPGAQARASSLTEETDSQRGTLLFSSGNFAQLVEHAHAHGIDAADGILFDLGWSSEQLATRSGLSYQDEQSLDMRLADDLPLTAADLIAELSADDLADMFTTFGEERFSGRVAAAIVREREKAPIATAKSLADLIMRSVPRTADKHLHPATRVFQALRIVVNREFENLVAGLKAATSLLSPGGRLLVITFHSLEDRLVKKYFRLHSGHCICFQPPGLCRCEISHELELITRSPIKPTSLEIKKNRRARSAKLRVAVRSER